MLYKLKPIKMEFETNGEYQFAEDKHQEGDIYLRSKHTEDAYCSCCGDLTNWYDLNVLGEPFCERCELQN